MLMCDCGVQCYCVIVVCSGIVRWWCAVLMCDCGMRWYCEMVVCGAVV